MISNQVKSFVRSFVFAGLMVICPVFVQKVMAGEKLPFDPGAKFSMSRAISTEHKGYDFVPPSDGYYARSSRAGTVAAVGYDSSGGCSIANLPSGFGYRVVIKHEDNTYTIYAHLKENTFKVSLNQFIPQGTQLGVIGSSGCSTGRHLHFQKSDEQYGSRYQSVAFDEPITDWSSIYSQNYGTDILAPILQPLLSN
ncbi:MAG TPA: M23 family metallopeptidase [Oculatellaceae cyanobacterium]